MQGRIPDNFKPILWSYDFGRLDPETHRKTIVVQAINYGTLSHWRWLREHYGRYGVRRVLTTVPATAIRPRARRLVALVFGIDQFNRAPRGTH